MKNICDIQNKSPVDKENISVHPEQLFQASGALEFIFLQANQQDITQFMRLPWFIPLSMLYLSARPIIYFLCTIYYFISKKLAHPLRKQQDMLIFEDTAAGIQYPSYTPGAGQQPLYTNNKYNNVIYILPDIFTGGIIDGTNHRLQRPAHTRIYCRKSKILRYGKRCKTGRKRIPP